MLEQGTATALPAKTGSCRRGCEPVMLSLLCANPKSVHALLSVCAVCSCADLGNVERQEREDAYKDRALYYHLQQVKESENV